MTRRRILKVALPAVGPGTVETGSKPRFLAIDWQGYELVAWVEAETGDSVVTQVFTALTGNDVPGGVYVGTAQRWNAEGPFVVHVYRDGRA